MGLLQVSLQLHKLDLLGYCLMPNHVHLILTPHKADGLGRALKDTHGRYAAYWNATQHSSGHVWQGRFYSCPLDEAHLWEALRYTELNPVRANLVAQPEQWSWSSAAAHSGLGPTEDLDMERWRTRWSIDAWRAFLGSGDSKNSVEAIRLFTHTGRPLGETEFVRGLERETQRSLLANARGRPRKTALIQDQAVFNYKP
jgi:putative transposase